MTVYQIVVCKVKVRKVFWQLAFLSKKSNFYYVSITWSLFVNLMGKHFEQAQSDLVRMRNQRIVVYISALRYKHSMNLLVK